jgi:hypothetical protein
MVKPERHAPPRVPARSNGIASSSRLEVREAGDNNRYGTVQYARAAFDTIYVVATFSNTEMDTVTWRFFPYLLGLRLWVPKTGTAMLRRTQILRIKHIEAINGWLKARPRRNGHSPTVDMVAAAAAHTLVGLSRIARRRDYPGAALRPVEWTRAFVEPVAPARDVTCRP